MNDILIITEELKLGGDSLKLHFAYFLKIYRREKG